MTEEYLDGIQLEKIFPSGVGQQGERDKRVSNLFGRGELVAILDVSDVLIDVRLLYRTSWKRSQLRDEITFKRSQGDLRVKRTVVPQVNAEIIVVNSCQEASIRAES